jgi:hypothetical protein
MQEELKIIQKMGIITSSELQELIDKNIRTIIRNLNRLEEWGDIKIMIFKTDKIRRRLYVDEEVYNDFIKAN